MILSISTWVAEHVHLEQFIFFLFIFDEWTHKNNFIRVTYPHVTVHLPCMMSSSKFIYFQNSKWRNFHVLAFFHFTKQLDPLYNERFYEKMKAHFIGNLIIHEKALLALSRKITRLLHKSTINRIQLIIHFGGDNPNWAWYGR